MTSAPNKLNEKLFAWIGEDCQYVLGQVQGEDVGFWWDAVPQTLKELWEELPLSVQLITYKEAKQAVSVARERDY